MLSGVQTISNIAFYLSGSSGFLLILLKLMIVQYSPTGAFALDQYKMIPNCFLQEMYITTRLLLSNLISVLNCSSAACKHCAVSRAAVAFTSQHCTGQPNRCFEAFDSAIQTVVLSDPSGMKRSLVVFLRAMQDLG